MTLWEFLKPRLSPAFSEEIERRAAKITGRGRLIPAAAEKKEEQVREILAILASRNVAVPVSDCYGEKWKEEILFSLDDGSYPDLAFLMFTSGTTGRPKGVMLSHENVIANLKAIGSYFEIEPGDRFLIARPLVHIAVLTGEVLYGLYRGAELRFFDEVFMPKRVAKTIREEKINVFCCTPTLFHHLSPYLAPDDLKTVVFSGERLQAGHVEGLKERFPSVRFYNVYGLTENSPRVSALTYRDFFKKPQSVGKPIAGTEMALRDGELWVRSPSVMQGYYHAPELTAEKIFPDGFLKTGDMARVDDDGDYYILGRKDDMIIRAGVNIYPQEIESVALQAPGVQTCLVYGKDDVNYGQEICIKAVGNLTAQDLRKYLLERLPARLMPSRFEIVDRLDMTPSGKIRR